VAQRGSVSAAFADKAAQRRLATTSLQAPGMVIHITLSA